MRGEVSIVWRRGSLSASTHIVFVVCHSCGGCGGVRSLAAVGAAGGGLGTSGDGAAAKRVQSRGRGQLSGDAVVWEGERVACLAASTWWIKQELGHARWRVGST